MDSVTNWLRTGLLVAVLLPGFVVSSGCMPQYPITDGFRHSLPPTNTRIVIWGNDTAVTGTATTWLQKRGLRVVERARLMQLFEEQRIRLTYTPDDEAPILRVGRILGAGLVVFIDGSSTEGIHSSYEVGRYGGSGSSYSVYSGAVSVRGVDVETSEVLWIGTARYPTQTGGGPQDTLMKLTCQALATAWGFRPAGDQEISSQSMCVADKPIVPIVPLVRGMEERSNEHASASPPIVSLAESPQAMHILAAKGDAGAQYNLGWLYAQGQGVPQDYAQARAWWEKAAAQGDAWARGNLGVLYANGYGVPQDYAKARQWYEKAATQGNALAQINRGMLYDQGQGVPQDYVKARGWYERAAAQGHAGAQINLGMLYEKGQGVPQDYATARRWYEQAAAQGDAWAEVNLASQYLLGQGVPQDNVRAYMWFSLAAANTTGSRQKFPVDSRDMVARSMTPAQIAEAQQLTQQCQSRKFKGC
jgi:Sel1 repeat